MSDLFFKFEIDPEGFSQLICLLEHEPKNIEEAWEMTLEKWKILSSVHAVKIQDGGMGTCGLCHLYRMHSSETCNRCPVAVAGHVECSDTPYRKYVDTLNTQAAQEYAKEELAFLIQIKKGAEVKDD